MPPRIPPRRVLLGLTLALVGCSGDDPAPRPNILLISMDTTRADHLSVYGYQFPTTPFLEEFAAEGARFEQAYAPAPATAPSHATLFTSLSPLTHRVLKNAVTLGEHHQTLAEMLGEAGYQTAAVLSSFVLNAKFGLGQGFQMYDDDLGRGQPNIDWKQWEGEDVEGAFARRGNVTTEHAVTWLESERDPEQPFFLFVHYFDPHSPYAPPRKYRKRFMNHRIESVREADSKFKPPLPHPDRRLPRRDPKILPHLRPGFATDRPDSAPTGARSRRRTPRTRASILATAPAAQTDPTDRLTLASCNLIVLADPPQSSSPSPAV